MAEKINLNLVSKKTINKPVQEGENNDVSWRQFLYAVDGFNTKLNFNDELFKNLKAVYDAEKKRKGNVTNLFVEEIKQIRKGVV
jgi:hypothetical protein